MHLTYYDYRKYLTKKELSEIALIEYKKITTPRDIKRHAELYGKVLREKIKNHSG